MTANKLTAAHKALLFEYEEKEKRAAELVIANTELAFQNQEKENRAAELLVANAELAFQNQEKENRAAELVIANTELAYQNQEKENRAAELVIANKELAFQNQEKEKKAQELIKAYKELESFNYITGHDLQEPLRKIQVFTSRIIEDEDQSLSAKGKDYVVKMQNAALYMQTLLVDLLSYSLTNTAMQIFEDTALEMIVEKVKTDLKETIEKKHATIETGELCTLHVIPLQFSQLMHQLVDNALKFSKPGVPPHIIIKTNRIESIQAANLHLIPVQQYWHISITDNGIGFDPRYKDHIFGIFKRLHDKQKISGTGIGLATVKKIIENHTGTITATGELNKGATFDIYIPATHHNH